MLPFLTSRLILKIALRNVRRNFRHSLAALLTMALGFTSLALFQGYIERLRESQLELVYSRMMIGEVLVQKPGLDQKEARIYPEKFWLNAREQAFLEQFIKNHRAEIEVRVRTLTLMGVAHAESASAQIIIWGHDVAEGKIARRKWAWNALAGHPLKETEPNGVLLGSGLGALLGCVATGQEAEIDPRTSAPTPVERPFSCRRSLLTLTVQSSHGRMNAMEAEVVGLTRSASRDFDKYLVWLPLPFAQSLASVESVSQYMLILRDPKKGPMLREELKQAAKEAGLTLDVTDWIQTEGADLLRRGMELLSVFRWLIFMVILIISAVVVLTTLMKTVRERTKEIATLRSLGYLRRHLLALFATEAAFLSLVAGLVGLLFSLVITLLVNLSPITYRGGLLAEAIPLRIGYSLSAYLLGFFFLFFVSTLAALLSARKVVSMRIAEAL